MCRRCLVHNVREDYERIVSEIQSTEDLTDLDLADEAVVWPLDGSLCYPVFTSRRDVSPSQRDCGQWTHSANLPLGDMGDCLASNTTPPSFLSTAHTLSTHSHKSPSTPAHSTPPHHSPCTPLQQSHSGQCTKEYLHSSVLAEGQVLTELPSDREGLLQLRTQLTMELLWIKQATTSRQQVS